MTTCPFSIKIEITYNRLVWLLHNNLIIGLVGKITTIDNKGTYLVKNNKKYDNIIFKRLLTALVACKKVLWAIALV